MKIAFALALLALTAFAAAPASATYCQTSCNAYTNSCQTWCY